MSTQVIVDGLAIWVNESLSTIPASWLPTEHKRVDGIAEYTTETKDLTRTHIDGVPVLVNPNTTPPRHWTALGSTSPVEWVTKVAKGDNTLDDSLKQQVRRLTSDLTFGRVEDASYADQDIRNLAAAVSKATVDFIEKASDRNTRRTQNQMNAAMLRVVAYSFEEQLPDSFKVLKAIAEALDAQQVG